ncbi:MAG TPA: membrane protein insertion efficiency factor YidD [Rhizomicrobium sp.]|nr:membrane protein insertion efficiency factor YidD [Rhizomicrobium sp.]
MALVIPIRLYRLFLSPLVGPACRFSPSCSEYAIEALHSHGPIKGTMLAAQRLSRCHPISWLGGSSGFDPVPPVR